MIRTANVQDRRKTFILVEAFFAMPPFTYRHRPYIHFDLPLNRFAAEALATSPDRVASHQFFPFIFSILESRKISPQDSGGFTRKPVKKRSIAYAGHADSHIFAHYSDILSERYEAILQERGLGQCVLAFRILDGSSNVHHAKEVFNFISQQSSCSALAMDVSDFFGNIDHVLLKAKWSTCMAQHRLSPDHFAVFKAITRYCQVERDALFDAIHIPRHDPHLKGNHRLPTIRLDGSLTPDNTSRLCTSKRFREWVRDRGILRVNTTGRGIPQGSPISAVLSNLYMLDLDTRLNGFARDNGGLYRRYCDDILLVMPTLKLRDQARLLTEQALQALRLQFNPSKTEQVDFPAERPIKSKPLQYLGFTFDGRHKRIRPSSVARYYRKMHRGVLRAKMNQQRTDNQAGITEPSRLKKKKLYRLYSYLGKSLGRTRDERRNFLSYAFDAARIMNDPGIKEQVKAHWSKLQDEIAKPLDEAAHAQQVNRG